MAEGDVREQVLRALAHGRVLPEARVEELQALGAEAVELLVQRLGVEGEAALPAARLLLRLRAPEALGPLVHRLMRTRPGEALYDTLLNGLVGLGPAVALAALEALAHARDSDERFGPLRLLAHCGARDERIYAALVAQLEEEPIPGAANLADYGDPRARESLRRVLAAQPLDEEPEELFVRQTIRSVGEALARLETPPAGVGRARRLPGGG